MFTTVFHLKSSEFYIFLWIFHFFSEKCEIYTFLKTKNKRCAIGSTTDWLNCASVYVGTNSKIYILLWVLVARQSIQSCS